MPPCSHLWEWQCRSSGVTGTEKDVQLKCTVEPRYSDLRYNDILDITINISAANVAVKCMEQNPDLTIHCKTISRNNDHNLPAQRYKINPDIKIKSIMTRPERNGDTSTNPDNTTFPFLTLIMYLSTDYGCGNLSPLRCPWRL